MLVLHHEGERPTVLLLGVGMIGSAVARALCAGHGFRAESQASRWDLLHRDLGALEPSLRAARSDEIAVVWCAGKADFRATADETVREMGVLEAVVRFTERLAQSGHRVAWHHVSSAGGLFEGQRLVGARSLPRPGRPYGELKLMQEDVLLATSHLHRLVIHRPSSVYGPFRIGRRAGLVAEMVHNGWAGRVTSIVGRSDTLRDYVWVDEVGAFIARRVVVEGCAREIHCLASGKPSSILEVQRIVERTIGRRIYVCFRAGVENAENISFRHDVLPAGWAPSPLTVGVRRVWSDAGHWSDSLDRPAWSA